MAAAVSGTKPELRRWTRGVRQGLDLAPLATVIAAHLGQLSEWQTAQNILLYAAMPDELDLLTLASEKNKHFYLPRCAKERRLAVHRYIPRVTPLSSGPFGIREPDPARVPESDPTVLDLVVVPAVLLAESGARLGYGGGYYDRFLPKLRPDCVFLGALPEALVVETLPTDPWDVALGIVVTESRVIHPVQ